VKVATVAGAANPGPARPTAPGTYTYRVTEHTESGDSNSTVTELVSAQPGGPGDVRRRVRDSSDSGNRPTVTEDESWWPDAMLLVDQSFTFGNQSASCQWSPPIETLALPLGLGHRWAFAGSCAFSVYGQQVTLKMSGTAAVNGKERVRVGPNTVDVWVIGTTADIVFQSATGQPYGTVHEVATSRFAPPQGLIVTVTTQNSASGGGRSGTSTETRELVSLRPA